MACFLKTAWAGLPSAQQSVCTIKHAISLSFSLNFMQSVCTQLATQEQLQSCLQNQNKHASILAFMCDLRIDILPYLGLPTHVHVHCAEAEPIDAHTCKQVLRPGGCLHHFSGASAGCENIATPFTHVRPAHYQKCYAASARAPPGRASHNQLLLHAHRPR